MHIGSDFISWLASDNGFAVHAGVLILLVLGGLGFPVPEDIPLLLAGVAISKGIVWAQAVFVTCYVGVILGDQTMYLIGYFFGHKLLNAGKRSAFLPTITEESVGAVREGLRKRRLAYIFLGRHLFPIRSVTFVTAGSLRVPFLEFLLADALAALVSVAIMLWLGNKLGDNITPETVGYFAKSAHYFIAGTVILTALLYFAARKYRASRKLAKLESLAAADPVIEPAPKKLNNLG